MKKLKDSLVIAIVTIVVVLGVYGIGRVKYAIWRAEHPQAETWTFFIPRSK